MASKGQQAIFDTLMEKPRTIQQLMEVTYLSDSFVRNTIRFMEQTGQVEKTDDRVPYVYKVSDDAPAAKQAKISGFYKKDLLSNTAGDDPILKMVLSMDKKHWDKLPDRLKAMAIAIEELEAEGKLIETL